MIKILGTTAMALTILAAGGTALADNHGKNPAVKARQALMQVYSHYIGTLGAMAKGNIEYDAEKAAAAAKSLHVISTEADQSGMWPAETSNAELGDQTRALPAIWSTYPAVMEKSKAMNEATAAMVEAAGVDLDSLRGAMKPLGDSCGGCHKDFRQPKD